MTRGSNVLFLLLTALSCCHVLGLRGRKFPWSAPEDPLPFVILHGIGDQCSNPGLSRFTTILRNLSGAAGICLEIGDGAPDSWAMRLDYQAEFVCEKVKRTPELANGFNMVGLSQGALIGRGYVEWCDGGPPVHNLVSVGGPHAGVASTPLCGSTVVCRLIDIILKIGIYSPFVQDHVAPTGYVKLPMALPEYYKGCVFLPRLNNEIAASRNATYKARFAALNHLSLVQFAADQVIVPKETAHFGYFAPKTFGPVVPAQETELYQEDWIGLKQLDEAGKISFFEVPGNHLQLTMKAIEETIIPFLVDKPPSLS